MAGSSSEFPAVNEEDNTFNGVPKIPIEIVDEEEMALLEAAMAAAARSSVSCSVMPAIPSSSCSLPDYVKAKSIRSITLLAKRRLSCGTEPDIEDSGDFRSTQKRNRVAESFLQRFRRKSGLSVTDITASEWCEKQMEFALLLGRRKISKAMRAGRARHLMLEEEVVKKVQVRVKSVEDRWALKLMNFVIGINQLVFDGLTRELPLIGFTEGVWMVGVIDEIRMPEKERGEYPMLVDTKTRVRDMLPSEPQQRNGRLQLMCYKRLWDTLVAEDFPSRKFFDYFSLNPCHILCQEIRENIASSGFPVTTLDDVLRYYKNTCSMMPLANNQLLLRYELQKDQSLLGEEHFEYDHDWLTSQIQDQLEFWLGEREARVTPEGERWKCRHCQFVLVCPVNSKAGSSSDKNNTSPNYTSTEVGS